MKKFLLSALAVVAVVALAITGTIAYLQWDDSDVNVMTLGNVEIVQHEYQRNDGVGHTNTQENPAKEGDLVSFDQKQPIYPAVYHGDMDEAYVAEKTDLFWWGYYTNNVGGNGLWDDAKLSNVRDKIIIVENTGKSDCYYRTYIAVECPEGMTVGDNYKGGDEIMLNQNGHSLFKWEDIGYATVDGVRYLIKVATYQTVLKQGEISRPSLLQVVLTHSATNEDMEALGGDLNVLAFSQAVQAEGFDNAEQALNAAFPDAHPFGGDYKPEIKGWVYDEEDFAKAIAAGDKQINVGASFALTQAYTITEDTVINGNGYTITRADGNPLMRSTPHTGVMMTVAAGTTVELTDVILDGGAVWTGEINPVLQRGTVNSGITATGALVSTEANATIILGEGAVLQNNDGANAVNLGTRIGAKLIINGGEIINNSSAAGAIWGGGEIVLNSGKVNSNYGGIGGAIRVVTNIGTVLTMNGGEMNHNYSAGNGGAIWAGASRSNNVYVLNGGEMAYNYSATTGGAIYAGHYETVKIGGTFKMHHNSAPAHGAIRFHDHASLVMTGGEIYENGANSLFLYNNSATITGGKISDSFGYSGGLGLTWGEAEVDGVISYNLFTNHNTAYLAENFNKLSFFVNEGNANFANFNFKPAAGYTYTEGDEAKLVCMNDDYKTVWNADAGVFKLAAK